VITMTSYKHSNSLLHHLTLVLLVAGPLAGCAVSWDGLAGANNWYDEEEETSEAVEDNDDNDEVDSEDGESTQEEVDEDGDGVPWPEDCHDGDAAIFPEAVESCDGLDNNCNGEVDDAADGDGDGFGACVDCDDEDADAYPGAPDDNDCEEPDEVEESPEDSLLATAGQWVAGYLGVELLTGSPTTDAAISQVITSLSPPLADQMVVVLEISEDALSESFGIHVGQGEAGTYSWTDGVQPAPTNCINEGSEFTCDPVNSLSLSLPIGDTLQLQAVELSGSLDDPSGTLVTAQAVAAVVADDLPDISTPDGSLADLMASRSYDLDLDDDGVLDAWSVVLSFTPIAF